MTETAVGVSDCIAHPGSNGRPDQLVSTHLLGVARLARQAASKVGMAEAGELLGLLHDLGKYSSEFQSYLRSASGQIDPDEDGYVDAEELKGKVDHSSAGAQLVWNALKDRGPRSRFVGQALALCIASHHSGLIDCVSPKDEAKAPNNFERRMLKAEAKTHLSEARSKAEQTILDRIHALVGGERMTEEVLAHFQRVVKHEQARRGYQTNAPALPFQFGLVVKILFSCLVDADRLDTADFENQRTARHRQHGSYADWDLLIARLERKLAEFDSESPVGAARKSVSDACGARSSACTGLYTLSVPTGGGKTLASLRFALSHAKTHKLDRIVYVSPYTSIIDQNAAVVREILEDPLCDAFGTVVLEHHSNLTSDKNQWRAKTLSENWDAPVVFTTSVQVLDSFFGGGTRAVRRLHQLANAVIIFDEVQTLPVRCTHLFCNAINYLVNNCNATVVLCTATQPLLGDLAERANGALDIQPSAEIISDVSALFSKLKRVEIIDKRRAGGWSADEIAELAVAQAKQYGGCLVVVNTKKAARVVYESCRQHGVRCFHLSTLMCPTHRMAVLAEVKAKLGNESFVCVSTQLIEAGVDVDFGSVIRVLAGLDSIAQAAGRCNRNGRMAIGYTYVVNADWERIDSLPDIKIAAEVAQRVLDEVRREPKANSVDLLSPQVMKRFYQYYFHNRSDVMGYPFDKSHFDREDSLLSLLSENRMSAPSQLGFRQAFMTAGKIFQVIDTPSRGVVVPYGDAGRAIIAELSAAFDLSLQYELLRRAQRFTVNLFPNVLESLMERHAVQEAQPDTGVLVLDERFYSSEFGVSEDAVNDLSSCIV